MAANSAWNLVNFRAPILRGLVERGYRIVACAPEDDSVPALVSMGVEFEPIRIDARGLSPLNDLGLLLQYHRLLRRLAPQAFLGFTPKPNIYGSIAARWNGVPVINTITGLGTGFLSGSGLQKIVSNLYRLALRRSRRVFFHNAEDRDFFVAQRLVRSDRAAVVAGSGVDLEHFAPAPQQGSARAPTFLFIGRFLIDKGAAEFAEAAAIVKKERESHFRMIGSFEDHPKAVSRGAIEDWLRDGGVELIPQTADVRPFIADADCVVLPSYREGLPRVLLEASAMARPVITTDVPGCRQAVEDGTTGLLCEVRSAPSLAEAMSAMAGIPATQRAQMGELGRRKAEREFSQDGVVAAYLGALDHIGV